MPCQSSNSPESPIYRLAAHAIFIARLDELRERARERGVPEKLIGMMGVKPCTRCGSPILVGPDRTWDVRTADCEGDCS